MVQHKRKVSSKKCMPGSRRDIMMRIEEIAKQKVDNWLALFSLCLVLLKEVTHKEDNTIKSLG